MPLGAALRRLPTVQSKPCDRSAQIDGAAEADDPLYLGPSSSAVRQDLFIQVIHGCGVAVANNHANDLPSALEHDR